MRFAQFYHWSSGWNGKDFSGPVKLVEACGSDSVLHLDGRWALHTCRGEAARVARQRGYEAYRIMSGPRYSDARALTAVEPAKAPQEMAKAQQQATQSV